MDELNDEINERRHLLMVIVRGEVAGYIYFEVSKDNENEETIDACKKAI